MFSLVRTFRIQSARRPLFAFVAGTTLLATLTGCDDPTRTSTGRLYGPEVAVGNGTARSYVDVTDGSAGEVGIELTEAALNGLPTGGDHMTNSFALAMPTTNPTVYKHLTVDWNPMGHEPADIYDQPHFDFHFYTIEPAARFAIDPTDPAFETKAATSPAAAYMPAGYVPAAPAVPAMGMHWVDPTSPELNGQPFTRTFIYGTWNGSLIFAEPMITRAYLLSKPNVTLPIPVADRAAPAGRYPQAYSVRFNATSGRYEVALTNLVDKQ